MLDLDAALGEGRKGTTVPVPLPTRARGWQTPPRKDEWEALLRGLDIAFQPIVNIHTGACYGVEALVRNTAAAGFPSVDEFFNACHSFGRLGAVQELLCERAAAKFADIPHRRTIRLFLNFDHRILGAEGGAERTAGLLAGYGIASDQVVFELSERHPFAGPEVMADRLRAYRRHGFRLAIDNFGTGFSGLQLLYFIEPDVLKIDRFFVCDIARDPKKRLFLAQIVHIAHLLGVVVLAEGIESDVEYFACRDIGCDLIQGHLVQAPTCTVAELSPRYGAVETLARRERRVALSDQKLIADQIEFIQPLTVDDSMEEVFRRFRQDEGTTFLPVVNGAGEPLGIVREKAVKTYAYSPFGKDLMRNRSCGRTLRDLVSHCPMADINSRAENILQTFSAVEGIEGILIVDGMNYAGFLPAHSLLRIINEKNLAAAREQNPLTKLPGNVAIHEYVSEALADSETAVTLAYFDFDNFKPFNDKYGFRLGDRAILLFAELLAKALPHEACFIGHVGGDDFFAGFRGMAPAEAERRCAELAATFAHDVESFYDEDSRREGGISGQDRLGNRVRFPLMTVSAALVHLPPGRGQATADQISHRIAELKKQAKGSPTRVASAELAAAC